MPTSPGAGTYAVSVVIVNVVVRVVVRVVLFTVVLNDALVDDFKDVVFFADVAERVTVTNRVTVRVFATGQQYFLGKLDFELSLTPLGQTGHRCMGKTPAWRGRKVAAVAVVFGACFAVAFVDDTVRVRVFVMVALGAQQQRDSSIGEQVHRVEYVQLHPLQQLAAVKYANLSERPDNPSTAEALSESWTRQPNKKASHARNVNLVISNQLTEFDLKRAKEDFGTSGRFVAVELFGRYAD